MIVLVHSITNQTINKLMKRLALAVVFTTALTFSANVFAQQPAPLAAAGVPGPGPGRHPKPPVEDPGPRNQSLMPVTTIQGKVVKLKANDDFTFDGFYLLTGSDSLLVKFPAHMGSQIKPMVKTGSQISVSGVTENPPSGTKELKMVTLTAGDKTLTESAPATSTTAVQETTMTGNGKVSTLQTDRQGTVNGIFLDNKTLLRFPPHIGAQLGNLASKGTAVSYSGSQKAKSDGEVQLEDYKIIRCNTLTVNGQQYLVK